MSDTVYVALDLEATEMHPERGEIIELGAIKFTTERVLDRWSATVRPRGPVPFGITQLTGITQAEARRAAPFPSIVPALTAFLRNHPIVGQSVWLDVEMLRAAGLTLANPLFDTSSSSTKCKGRASSRWRITTRRAWWRRSGWPATPRPQHIAIGRSCSTMIASRR